MSTCLKPLTVGENDLKIFAERSFTIPNPPDPSDPPIVFVSSHPLFCSVPVLLGVVLHDGPEELHRELRVRIRLVPLFGLLGNGNQMKPDETRH